MPNPGGEQTSTSLHVMLRSSAAVRRARARRSGRGRGMLSFVAKGRSRSATPAELGVSDDETAFELLTAGRGDWESRIAAPGPADSTFMFHFLVMSRDHPLHILNVRGRIKGTRCDQTGEPDLSGSTRPARYEIRVEEALDGRWSAWFDGLEVNRDAGETIISGTLADESVLSRSARKDTRS